MLGLRDIDITVAGLRKHYKDGDFTVEDLIDLVLQASDAIADNPIWITRLSREQIQTYIDNLKNLSLDSAPLYGIPFAIKDNIDLVDIPTTAACPDFTYIPTESAFVVQQLINAGAVPIGKTNMDQFATGLVGVRSPEPWGPCKNALNPEIISGGSSSGSAVAVALGLVSFSLGTDTAGSGRIPASLNNILGLKPSRGLLSNRGVVPACKSLDCVSIFALTAQDANTVFDVAAQFDEQDSYSHHNNYSNGRRYFGLNHKLVTLGVPNPDQLEFFGNDEATVLFKQTIDNLPDNIKTKTIDFSPFAQAAKLLYEGPWVSERQIAIEGVKSTSLLPVIDTIINQQESTAKEAFKAQYQLAELKRDADKILNSVDAIINPTAGTYYSIESVEQDPIQLNSNLGYYTNFMNLVDYSAVSVPVAMYKNGVGFGLTLFSFAQQDKFLLSIADRIQEGNNLCLGGGTQKFKPQTISTLPPVNTIDVVVCGAHLQGLPLNWQLQERGATLVKATKTSPHYRFYALAGGPPFRPGLIRDTENGAAIDVEVWRVPKQNFGSFVAEIPHPLGIGKVELADGSWCSGFICEPVGVQGAEEITHLNSWKAYLER